VASTWLVGSEGGMILFFLTGAAVIITAVLLFWFATHIDEIMK